MTTFTLDTNCLIDIDEGRPAAEAVQALAAAHAAGKADVAVVAMSASEKPKDGNQINNFSQFESRLTTLGLGHLNIIFPMCYWDVSFWYHFVWSSKDGRDLENRIYSLLFPNMQCQWEDFCVQKGIDPLSSNINTKWRNNKCDVQAIWSHINAQRQIFVTSDTDFHNNKAGLISLGAGSIEYPHNALRFL